MRGSQWVYPLAGLDGVKPASRRSVHPHLDQQDQESEQGHPEGPGRRGEQRRTAEDSREGVEEPLELHALIVFPGGAVHVRGRRAAS